MKKLVFTFLLLLATSWSFARSILIEGFEYANHDNEPPIGWTCDDQSWLCGYLDKDHNRKAHSGNWYAFSDAEESWMFMPLYFSSELKYRFSYWAVSDGTYDVELWLGDEADAVHMTQLLLSTTINGGEYEKIAAYIESISSDFQYFGIHAVATEGAYHLTIDDINVEMVSRFELTATPYNADTVLYPNSQATYHFDVQNLGYEPIEVIISPSHDYFTDFHFYVEGNECTTFHLEPDQMQQVTAEATLLPSIQVGTTCWLDIMLVLECDCATALTTLWVTVVDPTNVAEYDNEKEVLQVEIYDLTGKRVDASCLKPGVYIERTITTGGVSTRKVMKQ